MSLRIKTAVAAVTAMTAALALLATPAMADTGDGYGRLAALSIIH